MAEQRARPAARFRIADAEDEARPLFERVERPTQLATGVAQRGDRGGPRLASEQGPIADVVTRAQQADATAVGDRFFEDLQSAGGDDVHRVAALALAEQGLAALDVDDAADLRQRQQRR